MSLHILTALPQELKEDNLPQGVKIHYTGVGKINAALKTQQVILTEKPSLIINYGTVGKIKSALHGLHEVAEVLQRDMITEPLSPRGVTPFCPHPVRHKSGFNGVICATGDSFVTAHDTWLHAENVDIVEMELFAIAHACHLHSVQWRAFKYITDDANEESGASWEENVHKGEALFLQKLHNLFN